MAKRGRKKKKQDVTLVVVVLILASILMGVLIYSKSGVIGETLSPFLGGIMGYVEYILPIGIFVVAIYIACQKETAWMSKIVQFALMLLCIAIIMNVYAINKGQVTVDNKQMQDVMGQFYQLGAETGSGGGAAASIITIPLIKLLDKTGTVVLAIGGLVALTVSMFGIDLANKISEAVEGVKERKEQEEKLLEVEDKKEKKETKKEKRLREKLEKEQAALDVEQLKINLNNEEPPKGKLFNIDKEEKLFRKNKKEEKQAPEFIEDPLFKTQEKAKEEETKQVLQLEHTITVEDENYEFPPLTLLKEGDKKAGKGNNRALTETASKLQKTLYNFGVVAKVEHVSVGPAITRYELKPSEGVRVSKIANLADDIALNLAAKTIRIEAPIPGKQAVGIEVPNEESEVVHLRDILDTDTFKNHKSKLAFALGKDVSGEEIVTDIAKMPHVMIAGATGSGKSVCINTLIASIIYKAKPSDVKLIMVDPKIVELSVYNGIPHLMIPVVTDPKKAAGALAWAVQEMENRYTKFAAKGVRDLAGYNDAVEKEDTLGKLPHIVIIIDELADLMMVAKNDVEGAICRLAQKARAAGMHLVIATQRPSVDVITGVIKANIASRIAFAVTSGVDSRTIIDSIGAEKLLGKGDMLFYPSGTIKPQRIQGAYVSDGEVEKIVTFLKNNGGPVYSDDIMEKIEKANSTDQELDSDEDDETDEFLMDAIDMAVNMGQISASGLQRRFKIGYTRAGRIIDQMEARGLISGYEGSKPRKTLITEDRWQELKMSKPALETMKEAGQKLVEANKTAETVNNE